MAAAQSAGGHFDPDATKAHKGPGGGGHKGDLPKLVVSDKGEAKEKMEVKGLTLGRLPGKVAHDSRGGRQLQRHPQAARRRRRAHRLRRVPAAK